MLTGCHLAFFIMDSKEFLHYRKKLQKTQRQTAQLLGVSLKAVHSYEQGWRAIPGHVERQLLFLVALTKLKDKSIKPCWVVKKCPKKRKHQCPAWEFQSGKLCWFITGTTCEGETRLNWEEKMTICRSCDIFKSIFDLSD